MIKNRKISVVMTTFNGRKYIQKQLESIYNQRLKPDEVLIFDDCSSDDTYAIIERFIRLKNLTEWKLERNRKNLGWKNNFYQACSFVSGDIIFFSDQDDIWHEDKIDKMANLFIDNGMDALYANRNIINENDEQIMERMDKKSFTQSVRNITFSENFYTVKTLGCCECVSRKIIDIYLSLDCSECGHDSQCGRLALFYGTLWYLDKPVIDYRMHLKNTSGVSILGSYGRSSNTSRIEDMKNDLKWLIKLSKRNDVDNERKQIVKKCIIAVEQRVRYLSSERGVIFFSLLKYRKYYANFSMFIGDFAYRHNLNRILGTVRWKLRNVLEGQNGWYTII